MKTEPTYNACSKGGNISAQIAEAGVSSIVLDIIVKLIVNLINQDNQ